MIAKGAALAIILAALTLVANPAQAWFSPGFPSGFFGMCDQVSGGCAEGYGLAQAVTKSYAGPLLQLSNGSTLQNLPQLANHQADMTTWAAFCGSATTTSAGITTVTGCKVRRIYAEIQGSANDLIASTINATSVGAADCSAGGDTCACPFRFETATGLPILHKIGNPATGFANETCYYLLSGDGNAAGITAGTSSISLLYNGLLQGAKTGAAAVGIGHAWNIADVHGTTFYTGGSFGQSGHDYGNNCQTGSTYCIVADEESIVDAIDFSASNLGNVFEAVNFNSGANSASGFVNGGRVFTASPPAASFCSGCAGMNLPKSIHAGGGGDLGTVEIAAREFAFTNTAVTQGDITGAYAQVKANYNGLLTFTDFTPPTSTISVVQAAPATTSGGSGTSQAVTFGSPVGTGKHGVVVGVSWCYDGACATNPGTDLVSGITFGSNACSRAGHSFGSGSTSNGLPIEIWVCPNLTNAATVLTANFSTTVSFASVHAVELSCAISGCTLDSTAQGGFGENPAGTVSWNINATTFGNTTQAGELLFGVNSSGVPTRPSGTQETNVSNNYSQISPTGPSGQAYTSSWLLNSSNVKATASVAAIQP